MKKLKRNPEKFDPFELFSAMAIKYKYKLGNPNSIDDFLKRVRNSIQGSVKHNTLIHGKRTELLFAYVVGALGHVELLKQEDAGNVYSVDNDITPPDYNVILKDGTQFMVEVKNHHKIEDFSIEEDYYNKLEKYARICNTKLKVAIYFSHPKIWVLLPIEAFEKTENLFSISFIKAYAMSEMGLIGDYLIGTTPDLELRLLTDENEADKIDSNGNAHFVTRDIKLYCGDNEITDEKEKEIVSHLILFGDWIEKECEPVIKNNRLLGLKLVYSPEFEKDQDIINQGFSMIGTLSSMISRRYNENTVNNGKVVAVDVDLNPEDFKVFISKNYEGKNLPLWRFQVQPNPNFSYSHANVAKIS